jgi:hypothetical protein
MTFGLLKHEEAAELQGYTITAFHTMISPSEPAQKRD